MDDAQSIEPIVEQVIPYTSSFLPSLRYLGLAGVSLVIARRVVSKKLLTFLEPGKANVDLSFVYSQTRSELLEVFSEIDRLLPTVSLIEQVRQINDRTEKIQVWNDVVRHAISSIVVVSFVSSMKSVLAAINSVLCKPKASESSPVDLIQMMLANFGQSIQGPADPVVSECILKCLSGITSAILSQVDCVLQNEAFALQEYVSKESLFWLFDNVRDSMEAEQNTLFLLIGEHLAVSKPALNFVVRTTDFQQLVLGFMDYIWEQRLALFIENAVLGGESFDCDSNSTRMIHVCVNLSVSLRREAPQWVIEYPPLLEFCRLLDA
eukprot:PhF_6_TR11252/c0_g1_i1/m.18151